MITSEESHSQSIPADYRSSQRDMRSDGPLSASLDRLPPHSLEAEQGVLGCILLSPNDNMGICVEKFHDNASVFYDLRHQSLFELLLEMYDSKEPIDLITLARKLRDRKLLEGVFDKPLPPQDLSHNNQSNQNLSTNTL